MLIDSLRSNSFQQLVDEVSSAFCPHQVGVSKERAIVQIELNGAVLRQALSHIGCIEQVLTALLVLDTQLAKQRVQFVRTIPISLAI